MRWDRASLDRPGSKGIPNYSRRKVRRPPYEQLLREIEERGYLAVGRKYGVSDNAIRKWVRQYEREAERRRNGSAEPHQDRGSAEPPAESGSAEPAQLMLAEPS